MRGVMKIVGLLCWEPSVSDGREWMIKPSYLEFFLENEAWLERTEAGLDERMNTTAMAENS